LLAREPIDDDPIFFTDLPDVVRLRAGKFADAGLALHLAKAVISSKALERLTALIDAICDGLSFRAPDWLTVLEPTTLSG
jgi:hypothetical protein